MNLAEQCQQARSTIEALVIAQQRQHQRSALRERTAEWDKVRVDWAKAVEQAGWINLRPESVPDCARIQLALRGDAREAAKRLGDMQDVASLALDPLWTRLLQSTGKAADTLRAATLVTWRAWVESTERPIEPAALRAKVASIPANREILKRYEQVHAAYIRLATQSLPRSADDAAALRAAEAACNEEMSGLSYDVPPAVEVFFRAVDGGKATLANLTPEVLQWLREHAQLEHYLIRSKHA
ncbi:hypothetical protein [Dyella japonica]|uniref:Uncharacterized protein n=1 Tax=Dyella japonica TaxID=231455 RepID=A0ABV2JWC9_9GAMM